MKILITGADGLVASRVVELWQRGGLTLPLQLLTPSLDEFNLLNQDQIKTYLAKHRPDVVLHFAAYTNVSEAEKQRNDKKGLCWQVNVGGTRNLLSANSQQLSAKFIHISTDMVFPGSETDPGPYEANHSLPDNPESLTWYGWTKNQAERLVQEAGGTIVRLIYPVRAKFERPDYLRKPLQLFKAGQLYPLFTDQQVTVTFIDQLAEVLREIIETRNSKLETHEIYHCSTPDTCTPYDLVTYALERLGEDMSKVKKASIHEFLKTQTNDALHGASRYPVKGGLKIKQTEERLKMKFLKWKAVVDELVRQGLIT